MSAALNVVQTVFWGVIVLSLLVFVHEGGHYLASCAFHVRATEFFLGLPSRFKLSRKSRKVGTEFGVTPLLLGGYTRICGMESFDDELLADALAIVMREGRVTAEALAKELGIEQDRAYDLLATLSEWASIRPYYDPELGENPNQKTYPAAFETLERDANLLTEYDRGHDFSLPGSTQAGSPRPLAMSASEFLEQERSHTYQGVGVLKRIAMLVAGPLVNIVLAFLIVTFALMARGVDYYSNESVVGAVVSDSVAQQAGIEPGDRVISVGGTEVSTWDELTEAMTPYLEAGESFTLTCERGAQTVQLTVDPGGKPTDLIGIYSSIATYHPGFLEACQVSISYTGEVASYVMSLIQPQHTIEVLEQSSSVVGISVMASEAASSGAYELSLVVAAISMSLGFMNLLPIPPFDGGKILIELIQLIIRRPLSMRAQTIVSYIGIAFILFVFIFVLRNDVIRFVLG